MKRLALAASFAFALGFALLAVTAGADARGHAAATPTPSPSPSALPTATPEPPSIAIPRLQNRLKANPNDQDAMLQLAYQFLAVGRPDLAAPLSQQLIKLGNKSAQVYYLDGSAMQELGHIDEAVRDFEQASTIDPTNLGVLSALTELYLKTNRMSDAERVAKRAVTFNKTEPQAISNLGIVYATEGHFDDARAQFEQAFSMDPKDTGPLLQIANTYTTQNNIPMALTTIGRALAIDPTSVQLLVYKADLYAKQHDDAHVAQAYDDAVVAATSDDQKVAILDRKASYYVDSKKNDEAEKIFTSTIAAYPKVAAAHLAYGDYFASQKQVGKAIAEWKTALSLDKDNGPALMRMGQASMATGKHTDAVGYLKHYTQVAPDDAQGFALLGQAYSFVHDYKDSRAACAQSFGMQRNADTLGCVAGADFELKNYKEAAQIFDTLQNAAKGYLEQNPTLLYIAGKSYEHDKQPAKAIAIYKKLLPMMKKGSTAYKNLVASIAMLNRAKKK